MAELTRDRYIAVTTNGVVVVARTSSGKIVGVASIVTITKFYRVAYSGVFFLTGGKAHPSFGTRHTMLIKISGKKMGKKMGKKKPHGLLRSRG